ncbi:MAG TPA: hypothetical protein VFF17_14390 [Thermoanaerobaculia bacterium]|nr:hypothetical protein [Thermoanaerobaculia bacterium]
MRSEDGGGKARKSLITSVLLLAAAITASAQPSIDPSSEAWIHSPHRNFGPAQTILAGRALLFDEADDPSLPGLLAVEMRRLFTDLYARQGWRNPFSDSQPLRVFVARKEAEGVRRLTARSVDGGRRLVAPAVLLDGNGLTAEAIVREVSRQVARATLEGYGAPDGTFLTEATAALLATADAAADAEATLLAAAAPQLSLHADPGTLGRLFVDELARAAGPGFLVQAWERAAESGEPVLPVLLKSYAERTGETEQLPLARFAARLYSTLEPEATPSRVGLLDLQAGALDAAAPARFTLRHRTYLPGDGASALRVSWPEDAAAGAVVVRYRDVALPPDVLLLAAGDARTVPLGGVARLDWVVAGGFPGGMLRAPAAFETAAAFPYGGLSAHAIGGPDGPRLTWNTSSHEGLAGWAIFREEVLNDGRVARTGPEIIPSSNRAADSFAYAYLDPAASPATFYRYTVWAVTEDGLLSRAFSVTLRSAE